ncbi:metalloproteinase [Arthroderma uncinatum]|uniref:metalloproteinase n=1 Tax=Arthroderma uncinatum TaxID=74035 RepID=UPI00144AB8B3|nr:metalloproteinase [Arthroderma uncinatum]KAF3482801.1 metalloproteinase [Arthroderma uncinatum]
MQLITFLAAIGAPMALAATIPSVPMNHSMIDIQLSASGNSMIKAVITNQGAEVPFTGMLPRYKTSDLAPESFISLGPKASIEHSFDLATTHDLSRGGKITVVAHGTVPTAEENGTTITGHTVYESNEVTMEVDGKKAAAIEQAMGMIKPSGSIDKRTNIDTSSCQGEQLNVLETALANSARLSQAAASAAQMDMQKVQEYFKATDSRTVQTIVSRFESVARESSSQTSGGTTYYCNDSMGGCKHGVLAYTLPSQNIVINCPIYYSDLPALANSCHAQDQATTTLHEFTHNPAVVSPYTKDLGYGYQRASALPASKAIQNADTYALFANAVYVGC